MTSSHESTGRISRAAARRATAAGIAATALGLIAVAPASAAGPHWIGAWGAAPVAPTAAASSFTSTALLGTTVSVPLQFAGQTIRNIVNPHLSGDTARIRLSNQFGDRPITFTNVHIGAGTGAHAATIRPGTNRPLTFAGKASVTIPAGQTASSDPVAMHVQAFQDLVVSFYLPSLTGPATQHTLSQQLAYLSLGDHTADTASTAFLPSGVTWFFLTGVDVQSSRPTRSVVALGDSITDGFLFNTLNANHRYPDYLAHRLQSDPAYRDVSVINEGIAGNRLLSDNVGPSTIGRLQSDVLDQPGVTDVILQSGINDIANPPFIGTPNQTKTAADVIAGYTRFVSLAHAKGIKVYGTTITPVGDLTGPAKPPFTTYSIPAVNAAREKVNAFVRTTSVFDGFFDFDKALADPAHPGHVQARFGGTDGLHPDDAGYAAMADAVDLTKFAPPPALAFAGTADKPRLRRALLSGLRVRVSSSAQATVHGTLKVSGSVQQQLGLPSATVATGSLATGTGRRTFRISFARRAARALAAKRALALTMTLVGTPADASSDPVTVSRTLRLR